MDLQSPPRGGPFSYGASLGLRPHDGQIDQLARRLLVGKVPRVLIAFLFAGGQLNLHAYVMNDPVNVIDPTGLDWVNDLGQAGMCFGDSVTFGVSAKVREWMGNGDVKQECSDACKAGELGAAALPWPGGKLKLVDRALDGAKAGPRFIAPAKGPAITVPNGARGPIPTRTGDGVQYTGGSGGNGLHPDVVNVRIKNNGQVNYSNRHGQVVNPYTGQTVPKSDTDWWHNAN